MGERVYSWGKGVEVTQRVARPMWADEVEALVRGADGPVLAGGLRRSYGAVGVNPAGLLIDMTHLDRVLAFDSETGVLRAEAGASLAALAEIVLPKGWFFSVVPGTRHVTLGGAVANDVHGKNHNTAGTFGCHVTALGLVRSDAKGVQEVRPSDPLFAATVGGMGLTGVLVWVELQLAKVPSDHLNVRRTAFESWDDFWRLCEASTAAHTVAWVDSLRAEGRGIFEEADWAEGNLPARVVEKKPRLAIPFTLPVTPLNRWTVGGFNRLYFRMKRHGWRREGWRKFFFPLDGIAQWPRLYGKRGFYQYQCVLPAAAMKEALPRVMAEVAVSGQASFLAVAKVFGEVASPGLMSFPMAGVTLALDFPNRGTRTLALFRRLDVLVKDAGGRLYAAKDARMPGEMMREQVGFDVFRTMVDAKVTSLFWERVME